MTRPPQAMNDPDILEKMQGWAFVPPEADDTMIDAAIVALREWRKTLDPDERMLRHTIRNGRPYTEALEREKHAIRWKAMLAAAPQPKPGETT